MSKYYLLLIHALIIIKLNSKIHIIGDSHSHSFINLGYLEHYWATEYKKKLILVPYKIHWLGPVTMHRIGRDGLSYFNVKNFGVQENDDIITVFGEIDVRCHIGRIAELKNLNLDFLINKLAQDYIQTLIDNREQYNKINFIVFNVLPPTKFYSNQYFPYYGTLENRIFITLKLNAVLKELCNKFNFKFIDIYDLYTDNEGKLNLLLGNDDPHLNPYHTNPIKQCALKCVDLEKYNIEFTEKLIAYEKDYVNKN